MTLNDEQQQAVESEAVNTLVISGPGGGKTAVLAARIAWQIRCGVGPARLVAITYTGSAAREIQTRVQGLLHRGVTLGYIGTIHGYALRLLNSHGHRVGLPERVGVIDEQQAEELLNQHSKDLHYKGTKLELSEAVAWCLRDVASGGGKSGTGTRSVEILVADDYVRKMRTDGALSFDALIAFATVLMNATILGTAVEELLVDEYQDCSELTHGFVTAHPGGKFFVGDPDQAMMAFAGGNTRHILSLASDPDWAVLKLEACYRCSLQICDVANALIAHNRSRVPKVMRGHHSGSPVMCAQFSNAAEEMSFIANELVLIHRDTACAVLCRFNAQVNEVSDYLRAVGLPVRRREEQSVPRDWSTARRFVALAAAPENDTLAYWFVALTRGARFAAKVRLEAAEGGTSINRHYLKLPAKLDARQVPEVLGKIGVSSESIALVSRALVELPDDAGAGDLALALGNPALHARETGSGIAVSTIHSAKGKEWDCVFVMAFDDEILPGNKKGTALEEERRCAFVAVTRARSRLVLTTAKMRKAGPWAPLPEPATPSRFIAEMGMTL